MLLRNALLKQSTLLYAVFLREMSSRFGFAILAKHEAKAAASKSVYALIITMELDKHSDHEEKSLHCFRIFYLLRHAAQGGAVRRKVGHSLAKPS